LVQIQPPQPFEKPHGNVRLFSFHRIRHIARFIPS
jgi:hypothetical protein